ncbi:hypothetical protein EOK75_03970 [Pseudorhodobacter turbinis]|uniref:Uncharacterized protein n=1 Tax=Pseudorhodobacter turbinis TaxID=2500533 RepID=A0A4P8EEZ7_9RHOB|nr:hypothetical protein EOK75_03970 [Pseudorhodobacter turbinis]
MKTDFERRSPEAVRSSKAVSRITGGACPSSFTPKLVSTLYLSLIEHSRRAGSCHSKEFQKRPFVERFAKTDIGALAAKVCNPEGFSMRAAA